LTAHQFGPDVPESRQAFWERTFSEGLWDYLDSLEETSRYGIVAGYVHRLAEGGRVLDAGCGQGLLAAYLDLGRLRYTGFDVSPTAIRRAREIRKDIDYFVCSLDDFSCAPESYDMVVFNEVLSTLENSVETLRRYYGYVRAGGYVLISQFQNADPASNARASTIRLEATFESQGYPVIAQSEAKDCFTGKSWRIYCLQRPPRADSPESPEAVR